VFHPLTDAEKAAFCNIRNAWGQKIISDDINVQLRYGNTRFIDHFKYFNGIDKTVSQMIEVILVPDRAAKRHIKQYVDTHRTLFRPNGPNIQLFPSTTLRRWSWRLKEMTVAD
ncbi:MAG: hypothetical protein WAL37_04055, partial [Xanthobacteraceae bacterium]